MTTSIYTVVRPFEDEADLGLIRETFEGRQEMSPRSATGALELARQTGATLRLPESAADLEDVDNDQRMIINMGPQHPSTHGVLRIMLEIEGETVLRSKPVIGYLHTGMEKTAENLTYLQGTTNVTRMDYLSPINNELVFCLAVEDLLGIDTPPRAVWIRMLMSEMTRIASHVMWLATNGMDLGSTSMMIFGFRDREMVLSFFEKTSGLRMNNNYMRPGGVAADLPDGWEDDVTAIIDTIESRIDDYNELLTGQPIFRKRVDGVGILRAEEAIALSATGPILRSTGVAWDLRRNAPYLAYEEVDFDVVVGSIGDTYDRYAVRMHEIVQSIRIIRQVIERMPDGPYRVQDPKVTPPPRARIDESMEALIHHFKLFTEGIRVPPGETYQAIESPRGELGCYMVSDGSAKPFRMHIRGPSFVNLQSLPVMLHGGLLADAVAVISSVDPVMGEVDR
ncbi:MAG: NADH-quinone oxidoreductase subunit D [Ferrimicrobium sp.]